MMASKFLYDEGVDDEVFNDEWAASADMETEDINQLERKFLSAIVREKVEPSHWFEKQLEYNSYILKSASIALSLIV